VEHSRRDADRKALQGVAAREAESRAAAEARKNPTFPTIDALEAEAKRLIPLVLKARAVRNYEGIGKTQVRGGLFKNKMKWIGGYYLATDTWSYGERESRTAVYLCSDGTIDGHSLKWFANYVRGKQRIGGSQAASYSSLFGDIVRSLERLSQPDEPTSPSANS
jgi:hypothetical protein